MVQTRSKKNIEEHESPVPAEDDDDNDVVEEQSTTPSKPKKTRQKKRKEELKSKATGVGLKITVDGGSSNKKIVFDDDFVPSDDDNDVSTPNELKSAEASNDDDDDDDDNSDVEEVQGTAARDEVLDQMKTEAQQSLKTKKKRKRKARVEKEKKADSDNDDDDDDAMDEDFFAQLDSAREEELQQQQELAKLQAREAKGKHTTFVFGNKDENASSDPVDVSDNIQVVVLNNNQDSGIKTLVSDTALKYSRNSLKNGIDPQEGEKERKRKKLRSGPQEQPWKRAKKKVAMGRSRLTKGKPAAFFKRKRR